MSKKETKTNITLKCSVCGSDEFLTEYDSIKLSEAPDDISIKCMNCGRAITKGQLLDEIGHIIDTSIASFGDDKVKAFEKEILRLLKRENKV